MGRIKQKVMVWITACVIAVGLFAGNGMEVKAQGRGIDFNTAEADRIKNNGSYEFVLGNWFIIKMNEYDEVRAVYNIVYNKEIIRKEYAAYLRSDDKTGEFKIYAPTKTEKGEEVDSCGYESMEVQESKGVQDRKWKTLILIFKVYINQVAEQPVEYVESSPEASSHTHSFNWVTVTEPSVGVDGLEEYRCSCGLVEQSQVIPGSQFYVKDMFGNIKDAPVNGTVEYDAGTWHTISDYVLKKMSERPDATVTVKFIYKGKTYQIIFPAGTDYTAVLNDEDMMYGYFGVAEKLGLTVTELD